MVTWFDGYMAGANLKPSSHRAINCQERETIMSSANAMNVPAAAPKLGYLAHKAELDAAYQQVMDSGWYILGETTRRFEEEFAAFIGVKHAVGVATGTDAITLALTVAGIGDGDEVITTPLTAAFGVMGIMRAGAKPIFIDIDPVTYNLDPSLIAAALTPKTKAVMPVHLYGQPADLDAIKAALANAGRSDVLLIEDACQAHGAKLGEQRVGSIGDVSAFSFYPTKNLGGFGDGGMVTTNNDEVANKLRELRDGGQTSKYYHALYGFNSRLDEMQSGFLSVRLAALDADNERRGVIAAHYEAGLDKCEFLTLPDVAAGRTPVWHLFVIRTKHRGALKQHLADHGVGSGIHYPMAVHQQPFMLEAYPNQPKLPVAEAAVGEILSLPMYPELSDEQAQYVVETIHSFTPAE